MDQKHFWEKEEDSKLGNTFFKETQQNDQSRVPTGVEGMDELIEGGLKKGSVVLVEGGPGCGKSIFCTQFLINGITKYNENGVYINFEEYEKDFCENMVKFGWDLVRLQQEGKFAFISFSPEQVEKVMSSGGGMIKDVIDKVQGKRLVIDSLTAFSLLHKDDLSKREAVLALFKIIKKWGCTVLVTGQPEVEIDGHPFNILEFEVDGVIRLYNQREHNLRTRTMEVFKMRGVKHAAKTFTFEVTKEGIVIYPETSQI